MPLVYGLYAPNAPNIIDPRLFGGAGARVVDALRALDAVARHRIDTVVVSSPHWSPPEGFAVHVGAVPRQLYDFSGFPPALAEVHYEPPGDPGLARSLVESGVRLGLPVRATEAWGLDHGAWAPLLHVAPGATTPVVPTSIARRPPADHVRWGQAIGEALAKSPRRVAVIGTGSILHRLDRIDPGSPNDWPEGAEVEREVAGLAVANDVDGLLRFDRRKWALLAPEGNLGPLFVTMGAVGPSAPGRLVVTGQAFSAAGLSVIEFLPS